MTNIYTESAPLMIDITVPDKKFINQWRGYVWFSSIERINELRGLLEPHLDLPKVQVVIDAINQRLS